VPFFSDNRKGIRLAVDKRIKVSVLDKSGIFVYFPPRDLDFSRVIKLRLLLFPVKELKEGNIP
jgi:hypothetical protein